MIKNFKITKTFKFFLCFIALLIITEIILIFYDLKNDRKFIKKNFFYKTLNIYSLGETFFPDHGFYTYKKNLKNKQLQKILYNKNFLKVMNNYKFNTNNYGLVQNRNLKKNEKSYLILGSFFAEFLGYNNFETKLEKKIKDLQIINGGFESAGFFQSSNFEKYISKYFEVNKVIYIFESKDLYKFKLFKHDDECIIKSKDCNFDSNFGFDSNLVFQNSNILHYEIKKKKMKFKIRNIIKRIIKNTHIYNFYEKDINKYRKRKNYIIEENLRSIKYLKDKYKNNIIFVNVKSLNEIFYKKEKYSTEIINSFFNKNGIQNFTCEISRSKKIKNDEYLFHRKFENEIKKCIIDKL